jgi:hypothetical protein
LQSGAPTFITFTSPNILNINPGLLDVGSYSVNSIVSDGSLSTTYPISVSVTNTAPTFDSNPTSQSVYAGKATTYGFPAITDVEGHTVTISLSPALSWYSATLSTLTMIPSSSEVGNTFSVTVTLTDTFASSDYTMSI